MGVAVSQKIFSDIRSLAIHYLKYFGGRIIIITTTICVQN